MIEFTLATALLVATAGLACGFLNTVASSGSAVSLPMLIFLGLDPVTANATNRFPVLVAAGTASMSFHRRGHMPWRTALPISLPSMAGAAIGVGLAETLPQRDLGLVITAAVLVALGLLFTKVRDAVARAPEGDIRLGPAQYLVFLAIGLWLGFIVLDGATYLLLALVLAVRLPLAEANAVKSAVIVPTSLIALAWFVYNGHAAWEIGAVLAAGSVAGGMLGARLACSDAARRWIFRILVLALTGETVHLGLHYLHGTTA